MPTVHQSECVIDGSACEPMLIAVDLARVQRHPQPDPRLHRAGRITDAATASTSAAGVIVTSRDFGTCGGTKMRAPSPRSSATQVDHEIPLLSNAWTSALYRPSRTVS